MYINAQNIGMYVFVFVYVDLCGVNSMLKR